MASLGSIMLSIASACVKPTALALIRALKPDSQILFELAEDFVAKSKHLKLVSFYETKLTKIFTGVRRMVVEKSSAVLNLPNEEAIPQLADHRGIARFESNKDRNFRAVINRLVAFKTSIERQRDGGCGKTQIALRFAHRHRALYESAVVFINASSESTIINDFARIHDLLKLGDSPNKVDSVKRWLSSEKNSHWLLIFDNADDLESISLPKYFPPSSWGHIIITSRANAALNYAGSPECLVGLLPRLEALNILLERSGLKVSAEAELRYAEEIISLLGGLPLALDQAGAFIRVRKKSFAEYLRLYKTRQGEVLQSQPKIETYDRTILTAWEVNFRQIEQEFPEAAELLLLFCYLDPGDISEAMLLRGCTPQKRWSKDGELTEIPAKDEDVPESLVAFLNDVMRFDGAIEKLFFRDVGIVQRPHLGRILKENDILLAKNQVSPSVKRALASCLIASSRFGDTVWKKDMVHRAKMLLEDDDDPYVHAQLVFRENGMSRLYGMQRDSEVTFETFVESSSPTDKIKYTGDARYNAQRGDVIVSFAEDMILDGKLVDAKEVLSSWQPLNPQSPSTMERLVLRSRNITAGRIAREQGNFEDAKVCLENLLEESMDDPYYEHTGWRRKTIYSLASVYCELGEPQMAADLVTPELAWMSGARMEDMPSGRSLKVILAECQILLGELAAAEATLEDLRRVIEVRKEPDLITRTNFFRAFVGLARIAHGRKEWEKAVKYWRQALDAGKGCGWDQQYPMSIVRYSMAYVLLSNQQIDEGLENLEAAERSMKEDGPQYWSVGLSTYWLAHVKEQLVALERQAGIIWRASSQRSHKVDCSSI
ncbi:MAG: hypothetical protein Q9195_000069 [Heterodermia aff. obscurata]